MNSVGPNTETPQKKSDDLLESLKGKFDHVVVLGLKNNVIDIATSNPSYMFTNYVINRALFELILVERINILEEVSGDGTGVS